MLKKVAFVGAAGLLTAAVLTQTSLGSYLKAKIDRCDRHFESKIAPEDEVRRIKQEVNNLDKDIDKARASVAEERVEAKMLKARTADKRSQLEASRASVDARGKMMKDAADSKLIKWDGRSIDFDRAKDLLQAQVTAHKTLEKDVKANETMLAVRERTRDLAEQHLQALISQKSELEAAVVELEADIKMARIEQVQSKYQNDGTRMVEVKESLAKLRKRIEVQREKLAIAKQYGTTGAADKSVDEILAELDAKEKPTQAVGH